ncbi:teneurin-m-like isoform X2 [Cherax quadricarinatus]
MSSSDRYQSSCVTGEVPGLVTAGNSLTSPYFSQHQLRMGQGSGRRFSPLRLPLGASKSSWRRCSWRCTTVVFVCVTLCLAATTTFFATSQVGGWHNTDSCLGADVDNVDVSLSPALDLPSPRQPDSPSGNIEVHFDVQRAPSPHLSPSMIVNPTLEPLPARPSSMNSVHSYVARNAQDAPDVHSLPNDGRRKRSWFRLPLSPPVRDPPRSAIIAKSGIIDGLHVYHWFTLYVSQGPSAASAPGHGEINQILPHTGVSKHLDINHQSSMESDSSHPSPVGGDIRYQSPMGSDSSHQSSMESDRSHASPVGSDRSHPSPVGSDRPKATGSTGSKLSTLDTTSPGIDLAAGEEDSHLPTLHESLMFVNHENIFADNTLHEPGALTQSSVKARRVRSASDVEDDAQTASHSLPLTGNLTSILELTNNSFFVVLTSKNTPSGGSELGDAAVESPSRDSVEVGSRASSETLMNNPQTLATATAHGQDPQLTAVTGAHHYIITRTAATTTRELAAAPPEYRTRNPLSDAENAILQERESSLVSRQGIVIPDLMNAPSSPNQLEIFPPENSALHSHEYQATGKTLAAPLVLPSFQDTTPVLLQHVDPPSSVNTPSTTTTTLEPQNQIPFSQDLQTSSSVSGSSEASVYVRTNDEGTGLIDSSKQVDLFPPNTQPTPVETTLMTIASTKLVDSAQNTSQLSLHSLSVSSTTTLTLDINTNMDINDTSIHLALAVTGETEQKVGITTDPIVAPLKPLSDEHIKLSPVGTNNTKLTNSHKGFRDNHTDDNLIPDPHAAAAIAHNVGPELGEAHAGSPRGQVRGQSVGEEKNNGEKADNFDIKYGNKQEYQSEETAKYKMQEGREEQSQADKPLAKGVPISFEALMNQEQRVGSTDFRQDLEGNEGDRNLKISPGHKESLQGKRDKFESRETDNDDANLAAFKFLTFHQENRHQTAEFSALRTVQSDEADGSVRGAIRKVSTRVDHEALWEAERPPNAAKARTGLYKSTHGHNVQDTEMNKKYTEEQQRDEEQNHEGSENKDTSAAGIQSATGYNTKPDVPALHTLTTSLHTKAPSHPLDVAPHSLSQVERHTESTQEPREGLPRKEGQILVIFPSRGEYIPQDGKDKRGYTTQGRGTTDSDTSVVGAVYGSILRDEPAVFSVEDSVAVGDGGGDSAVRDDAGSSAVREGDAGSSAVRDDAGSSAVRDDAGSSAVRDDAGSSAVRDDAGSSAVRDDAGSPAVREGDAGSSAVREGDAGSSAVREDDAGSSAVREDDAGSSAVREDDAGSSAVREDDAGSSAVREDDAGSSAVREDDAGSSAVREDDAGSSAVREDDAGSSAVREDDVGSSAVREDDAGSSAVREDDAGSSAVREDDAGSSAVREDDAGSSAVREDDAGSSAVREDDAGSSAVGRDAEATSAVWGDSSPPWRDVGETSSQQAGESDSLMAPRHTSLSRTSERSEVNIDQGAPPHLLSRPLAPPKTQSTYKDARSEVHLITSDMMSGNQKQLTDQLMLSESSPASPSIHEQLTDQLMLSESSPASPSIHEQLTDQLMLSESSPASSSIHKQLTGQLMLSESSPASPSIHKQLTGQLMLSESSPASPSIREDEKVERTDSKNSFNYESLRSVEAAPFSDNVTPSDAHVRNTNSYEGVGGALALPVIGDISLQRRPSSVKDQPASVGITGIKGIGINDLTDKDQRNKMGDGISSPPSNQTGEIATKGLVAPTTHINHNVNSPHEYKRQESIESLRKQSAPGSGEASSGPGYNERKESSIDTTRSEANQEYSFLSRSNQVVADPNHKSVHAQVSPGDPTEENREDLNPSLSILSAGESDVESNTGSDEYDYEYDTMGFFEYDLPNEDTDYEENNNNKGLKVGGKDPSRNKGIDEDGKDLKRIPGSSLDRPLEDSLLDEENDTGASGRDQTTRRPSSQVIETVLSPPRWNFTDPGETRGGDEVAGRPASSEGAVHNSSSADSSSSRGPAGSHPSLMPHRELSQSPDSPCKCSCQCDGGENPTVAPGRVEANLNSWAGVGGVGEGGGPPTSPDQEPTHPHRHHHSGTRNTLHTHPNRHYPEGGDGRPVNDSSALTTHKPTPALHDHFLDIKPTPTLDDHLTATHQPTPALDDHLIATHQPTPALDDHLIPTNKPTPALEEHTILVLEAPREDGKKVTGGDLAGDTDAPGVVVIKKYSYTLVNAPEVTHVVAAPDAVFSGSTRPTLQPTSVAGSVDATKIHATLILDSQGGMTMRRPQQVAPPDGASFSALALGEEKAFTLTPYGYWNIHLTLNDLTDLKISLTIPRGTSLGLYARRSALPTHTQHDIMKILRGTRQRDVRASPNMVEVWVEEVLEAGEWFLSLYNDDGEPHQVALVITRGPGEGECPQRCEERGHCILGRCQCEPGYSGIDCSQVLCPILCSGHGDYMNGQCRCHPGYKGKECQLRHHECEVPDCNSQGQCIDGQCHCAKGYTGDFCQTVDCPHPTCSGNGWCVLGSCVCQKGWRGPDCSETDLDARQCLPDCNNHGAFDIELHTCVCHPPWTGSDCSKKSCSLDCGLHGICENDACACDEGWKGDNCLEKLCDARCSEHGQCKNGTCVCMTGWNGRHCTLSGCPSNCRSRGTCEATVDGTWYCRCETGWDGPDCSAMLETLCNDGKDNDRDGLTDCQDPECCTHLACNGSQLCVSRASSPIDILLRKQPPAATASFFEKMKFLIEEDSLQHFTSTDAFNMRRAAVVRGRVVTRAGRGVVGLRVATMENQEGFTLTRRDGWFDIMVNGGGAVTLTFGKPPFSPKTICVMVPWNEVVVLDDIMMTVTGLSNNDHTNDYHDHQQRQLTSHCPLHDYDLLRPVVMATWQNVFQGECPDVDAILVESQAVQESVQIPGTGMYLVYHSSRANGYESTIRMQLTPDHIPATLRRIHLRIVLEGTLFTRVFEADPNIKFTYAWDRLNVYRQRVLGVTVARVSVGYEHASCPKIIWEHQTARVAGNDLLISKVGGFNLHVHHAYNYHQGILQKGNGQNIYLAGQRRLVTTLLGTGEQREVNCGERCEGRANLSPLLAPTCLASAPDGSLYVGDFNLIRRVKPDGTVITVARLNETRVSYRYHVAVSPLDGSVYVSDPEAHQVLKLTSTSSVLDPHHNAIAVAGSGQRCLPGDRNKCGDGGYAIHARLTYPKGLAISSTGDVYIADGTNIRVMNPTGIIYTVIGGHDHRSHWAPVPCNGTINMDQLHLRWPTELAISPLDGSLHILDDHLILRVTPDNRVQVLSGRSLNCPTPIHDPPDISRTALLLNPQSIAFSPQGELYVAESDTQRINRVRIITSDGRISIFAGADSRCNCRDPTCYCHTYDNVSASSAIFSSISSIAVTPDGVLHISDQAGYRVRSVRTVLPEPSVHKQYEIFSPDAHEVYIFNKYGQHVETRNLVTGQTIYKFSYSINSSEGRLLTVTDGASNRFQLIRNYFGDVTAIENPQKQRVKISLSMMKMLEQLVAPDGYNITFRYHGASGLMHSKIEAVGRSYNYDYDEQGRLTQAVLPTGQVIQLTFDLSTRGAEVMVTRDGKNPVRTRVRGNTLTHNSGPVEAVADMGGDGQLRMVTDWGHEVSLERTSYRVLESTSQIAAEMFPILSRQQTHITGELVNRYEWIYSPANHYSGGLGMKVAATLRVNGADLLTLSYDPVSSSEALLSVSGQMLINITYDTVGRPVRWIPVSPLVPSNVSYDHWGHITGWTRGNLSEEYHYDSSLRLTSVTYADGATVNYDYREKLTKPEKVTHPSGRAYGLVYDDAGSLRQVLTPRGSAYTLHLSTSLGFYRLRLALPVDTIGLQIRLDERGRLLAMTQPGRGGTLIYQYNDLGQVSAELYGHGFTEYTYYSNGLIRTAKTKHKHVDVRTEYRYHAGLMKDMRLRYGSKSDLHPVKLRFQYDGSARLRKLEGDINSDIPLNEVYIRFDNQTGVLQLISDLRIIRNNILETMLQNPKKHYVNTRKQDDYGRLSQVDMTLQGKTVFMMRLKYDIRNRISERLIEVAGRREGLNITYMADGQILEATGTHTWLYSYDENGNIISNTDKGYAENLVYDECDRVTSVSGSQVEYDDRGFVIRIDNQNFDYNTKGQLISGWNSDENWSFTLGYDHLSRISIYRDHNNNATQLIYGRPDLPELITHLHNPHTGATTGLLYDDMNHLIAIDQPDGRYFVATDQNGTPIAIFDDVGSLIRSQVWSPFGHLVDKAGSNMWVGVGPWGKFREPQTGLVIFRGYAYHPKLLQWMSPRWGHLTQPRRHVTDVFVYRFMNNNPFNPTSDRLRHYYTDVSDWLELYGIELSRVLGSEYHENTLVVPHPVVAVDEMGASEVVSGLWCQYRAGVRHLHDLSFFSQSHIQHRMGMWNGVPISRQASIFGPGVLVSDIEGRVLVTGVGEDDFSGVIGDVIRTVLNNSIILDVSATHSGLDTFYFIKSNRVRAIEDINHLRRLSGIFNVTTSDTEHGQEIRMSTPTAHLVIMYGERVQRARSRVLGELEEKAEELAWAREAALVSVGRPGTHVWSPVEAAELVREGRVPGYVATHLHSTSRYPLLAADASNIVFKHESSRKRRKSRRKGRKKSWRQRKKVAV